MRIMLFGILALLLSMTFAFTIFPPPLKMKLVDSCNFIASEPHTIFVLNSTIGCGPDDFGLRFNKSCEGCALFIRKNAGFLGMPKMGDCFDVQANNVRIKGNGLEGLAWWNCAGIEDGLTAKDVRNLSVADLAIAGARGDSVRLRNTTSSLTNVTTR